MRIRSIKPEFWRSEDVAALDWCDRLLFIGLWSYVDDNGVGRDIERIIVADLFALEEDTPDTLATVSRGLQNLSDMGLISRYKVDGKRFLFINKWDQHQRIDKPAKPRFPRPQAITDTLATSSGDVPDLLAPGTGEQGNRGTEDQGFVAGDSAPHQGAANVAPRSKPKVPRVCPHHPDEKLNTAGLCRCCEADRKAAAA